MAVYAHPDKSAVCIHEEMGYRETFLRISKGFFDSIDKPAESKDKPRFVEVWVSWIEDVPSAVTRREFYDLENGNKKIIERETSLDKYKPGAMYGDDVLHTTQTDSENLLISEDLLLKRGGYDLVTGSLNTTEDGEKYKFYFKAEGGHPPLAGAFPKDKENGVYPGMQNNITARKRVREIVKNKGSDKFTMKEFHVSGDPRNAQRVTYKVDGAETPAKLNVSLDEMKISLTADADGMLDSLEMNIPIDAMNPNIVKKVVSKRVFMQGQL
jgi:hypothetical protein